VIVRILGEGQLQVDDSAAEELNDLDSKLEAAVEHDDEIGFRSALDALLRRIRSVGRPLPLGALAPSELIIPQEGATMAEVHKLLTDDGLIPG
jgi:hypothetical protein